MKIKELIEEVKNEILTDEIKICKEQLKIRQREIRKLKRLLKTAENDLEKFLEQDVEDVAEDYEYEY